jgi:hypothetical protein
VPEEKDAPLELNGDPALDPEEDDPCSEIELPG